jgi:gliding motility-associated-like protein
LPYGLGISDSNKIYIAGTSTLDSLATPGTFMPTKYPGSTYLIFGFIRKYSPACPVVTITGDTLYCIGDTLKLNAQSDDSPYGWKWTGPNGFSQSGDEAMINDITQQDSGLYVFSDSIKCNIDSFRVLVFEPQKLSLDSSYSLCAGDTVSIPHHMQQINWQPQYNAQNKSDSLLLLYPSQDTNYSIVYIDTNGCSGKDSSYILANNLTATANWQDTIYCGADSIPLDIAVNSSRPFDFSYVDAVSLADTSELNTFFEVEGNDVNETFGFVVNDSVGCRDSLAFSVVAGAQPKASLDYSLDIDCNGAQSRLTASSTDADSTYWIIDGERTREGETSFTLPYRGNTTFTYWAVNSETCKDSANITIGDTSLSELLTLEFPTIITPNGDGINDYFELKGNSDLAYCAEVQIFNRWGNLIFEGTANEIRWDGKSFSGEEVPPGTYYFTATVGNQQKRGSITVLK